MEWYEIEDLYLIGSVADVSSGNGPAMAMATRKNKVDCRTIGFASEYIRQRLCALSLLIRREVSTKEVGKNAHHVGWKECASHW